MSGKFNFLSLLLGMVVFILLSTFSGVYAQPLIMLDGKEVSLDLLFKDEENRLFIPLKELCQMLKASYKYNPDSKIIIVNRDDRIIKLQVDNTLVIVNDEWKYLEAPVQQVGEDIIVPLKAIAEYLGGKLEYKAEFQELKPVQTEKKELSPAVSEEPAVQEMTPYEPPPALEPLYEEEPDRSTFPKPQPTTFFSSEAPAESSYSIHRRVGLGAFCGYYRPDSWGTTGNPPDRKFLVGGNLRYGFSPSFAFDVGISHWSETKRGIFYREPVTGDNRLEIIDLSFDIIGYFLREDSRLKPFLGVGLSHYHYHLKYNNNAKSFDKKDSSEGFNVIGGLEYFFTENFSLYNYVKYQRSDVTFSIDTAGFTPQDVNVKLNDLYFGMGMCFWF